MNHLKRRNGWVTLLLCLALTTMSPFAIHASQNADWREVDRWIGVNDAVMVVDNADRIVFQKNARTPLIPASTLKVFTALVALHYLKNDFRFKTECFVDTFHNLKIRGYGDPLFISEVIREMAVAVRPHIQKVKDLWVDDSYFDPVAIPGVTDTDNPYDAPNGALSANFNTVHFKKENGRYASAEPQTPLLDMVEDRILASGQPSGRIRLSGDEASRYAGELVAYFLSAEGLPVTGKLIQKPVDPATDRLIVRHESPFSLKEVIAQMLEYSNNFIANQLLIAAGIAAYGPPGSLEKGVRAAEAYGKEFLRSKEIMIEEGSGISRKNRISAEALIAVLKIFKPHAGLMRQEGPDRFKTGSLSGVKTRAGYLTGHDGRRYSYVILINTSGKTTDPVMASLTHAMGILSP